jgi:hypothetical protein
MPNSEGGGETDVTDVRLTDVRLAAEIELLGEVIAVVAEHEGPLSAEEVDEVLGATDTEKDPASDPAPAPDSH